MSICIGADIENASPPVIKVIVSIAHCDSAINEMVSSDAAILLTLMAASLLTISFIAESQWAMLTMTFITGGLAFSISAPIQMLMIKAASGSEMLASSVNQAGFNIGNAIGAFLGGIPIAAGYG